MDKQIKTGTTIVGLKYKSGILLCADTRSTSGPVVSNKNCEKIHFISEKIMCCGAGTAADTRSVTRKSSKQLQLFQYQFLKDPYVTHAQRYITDYLHNYGGQICAALILGGIDTNGSHLFSISPEGYSMERDYTSLGSGSLAAIAVLEDEYKKDMEIDEAMKLGVKAIKAGILNDLYSGSNVDLCVIDIERGVTKYRNYEKVGVTEKTMDVEYPKESVIILKEEVHNRIVSFKDI